MTFFFYQEEPLPCLLSSDIFLLFYFIYVKRAILGFFLYALLVSSLYLLWVTGKECSWALSLPVHLYVYKILMCICILCVQKIDLHPANWVVLYCIDDQLSLRLSVKII